MKRKKSVSIGLYGFPSAHLLQIHQRSVVPAKLLRRVKRDHFFAVAVKLAARTFSQESLRGSPNRFTYTNGNLCRFGSAP
jgi:hypothetical protein